MRIPLTAYENKRNEAGFLVLPKVFSCKDGEFQQLKRVNDIAIYQRDSHFEVIKILSQEPFEITKGIFTEKKENFPSSTTWGTMAYTCLTLEDAEKRFNQFLNPEIKIAPAPIEIDPNRIKSGRGRKPVLKVSTCCGAMIYTSVFAKNKGKCPNCINKP